MLGWLWRRRPGHGSSFAAIEAEGDQWLQRRGPLATRVLDLPWSVNPVCVIPIGWANGNYGLTTRAPIADVVPIDRYGNQPPRPSS